MATTSKRNGSKKTTAKAKATPKSPKAKGGAKTKESKTIPGDHIDNPQGLGDQVHNVLNSPAVKPVTEALKKVLFKDGEDCGCNERRERWNKLPRIGMKRPRCLTEEMYNDLKTIEVLPRTVDRRFMDILEQTHAYVFNHKLHRFCGGCQGAGARIRKAHGELMTILKSYEDENLA